MDQNGVRRKDTTRGPPLRILSLDGGGVRGYSMFLIIQELMHRTFVEIDGRAPRRAEIPKPCEHFDLIVGTGTGGLIALMLGRLRLDLETCKELYVRLTRMVFETDKTIVGIPYKSTLFKATKLEEAIRECVREHTISETEGNDSGSGAADTFSPLSAVTRSSAAKPDSPRRHSSNASVISFSARSPTAQLSRPMFSSRGGNANARLYDERENRTKTAVTAVYKGTVNDGEPAILRSYDSRKEPAPEYDCKIWEAGRATCAVGLAFKPIQIGQSMFHDDGGGNFNPSVTALDEAVVNEWPGREVGVFVSVGTGKRPSGSDANSHMWYEGFLGEFAEARRRLIAKIEGCEKIHEYVQREHLAKRGVNIENYYRFNVEVGVGEFGMNEWNRLAEIATSTRRYMGRGEEQKMVQTASAKLAKIYLAKQRLDRMRAAVPDLVQTLPDVGSSMPLAVELPGDIPAFPLHNTPPSRQSYESGSDNLSVPGSNPSPRSSGERVRQPAPSSQSAASPRPHAAAGGVPPPPSTTRPQSQPQSGRTGAGNNNDNNNRSSISQPPTTRANRASNPPGSPRVDEDRLMVTAPTPAQFRHASGADKIAIVGPDDRPRRPTEPMVGRQPGANQQQPHRIEPPPLPPKTPLLDGETAGGRKRPSDAPPYPMDDEPPPAVNMAKKPDYRGR